MEVEMDASNRGGVRGDWSANVIQNIINPTYRRLGFDTEVPSPRRGKGEFLWKRGR